MTSAKGAFVHLHVHSEYSLLDASCRIENLASRAASFGQPALALTDHGVMSGAVAFYKACQKWSIKPIVGLEAYFVDDRHRREGKVERNHLTLLAENGDGYRNLLKLSTAGFLEGMHRGKPGIDLELLDRHADGVICLTGCLASRSSQRIVAGKPSEAQAHLDELMQVFGPEDVYFEVQRNGLAEQELVNQELSRLSVRMRRPLVATGDVHYLRRVDYHHHTAMLCVQTKSTLARPEMSFETNEFFLKSTDEMTAAFADMPGAVAATLEVAERCNVEIELGERLIPDVERPDGVEEPVYLRELVEAGIRSRYGDPPPVEAVDRMEMELGVIDDTGFNGHFLLLWDIARLAREHGISIGPGRGVATSSLVNYCLGVTDVDPLRYGLIFARLLHPDRTTSSIPYFDVSERGRERLRRLLEDRYGPDRVAEVVTFSRLVPRAATIEAARVLGHEPSVAHRLATLIPDAQMGWVPPFDTCLEPGADLAAEYEDNPVSKQIVDVARGLENLPRHASIRLAPVVISPRPLTDLVPLQLADSGMDTNGMRQVRTATQFERRSIEDIGLLEAHFLGSRALDIIADTLANIESTGRPCPDLCELQPDDPTVIAMFAEAATIGVGEFHSRDTRSLLARVRPVDFDDLVALVVLRLPGGRRLLAAWERAPKRPGPEHYIDERLRPILDPTRGIILFQEQLMQIAMDLAGLSPDQADDLRIALAKRDWVVLDRLDMSDEQVASVRKELLEKSRRALAERRDGFLKGCRASRIPDAAGAILWDSLESSALHVFARSHAVPMALTAYRTAWLKQHYPIDFMAALLTSNVDRRDKLPYLLEGCDTMGVPVLMPDINSSDAVFRSSAQGVRFGLTGIRGVDAHAADAILRARTEGGPFTSLWDFCFRVDARFVDRSATEALITSGAFRCFGRTPRTLLASVGRTYAAAQRAQHTAKTGQTVLFTPDDALMEDEGAAGAPVDIEDKERLAVEDGHESPGLEINVSHPNPGNAAQHGGTSRQRRSRH